LEGVSKSYGTHRAISDISLGVRRGEIFGYTGPNGAGKTTTIKILVGLIKEYEGTMSIGSNRSGGTSERTLGYLPQHAAFQEWRTVGQALTTFGRLSRMTSQDIERRVPQVLDLLGISETRDRKVVHLSGGTIQKVGMAQAILHEPEFLVLDEPMAGLDPASRYQFKNVFRQLAKDGTTILFSSHILSDVQDIASRVGIMSRGKLMHVGTLDDLKERLKVPKDVEVILSKDANLWKELEHMEGVKGIDRFEPGRFVIHLVPEADLDASIDRLMKSLLDGGSKIRSIYPIIPNLEQLYFQFVTQGEPA
jgi:ABC-2 type transport system ATP-binding protein